MSNEEQAPREPGTGRAPDSTDGQDGPALVDPDDVVLDDGDVSADVLEPELSVSPEALDLEEPALGPVRINTDAAEAASLEEAAAEARAVAAEAEETGMLVGGPMPADAPLVRAAPDGTAPAGGAAGDPTGDPTGDTTGDTTGATDTTDPAGAGSRTGSHGASAVSPSDAERHPDPGHGGNDQPREDAGVPVGGHYAFPPEGGEPGLGHPGLYPGTDPAFIGPGPAGGAGVAGATGGAGVAGATGTTGTTGDTQPAGSDDSPGSGAPARAGWVPEASDDGTHGAAQDPLRRDRTRVRSSALPLLLVIGGAVVLLGLLVWLLVSLFSGSDDEQRVDPSSLASGECLAEFTDITEDAARVDCSEPHNAQLVASESYPEDAEFPGREQLGLRAEAACADASSTIDPDVVTEDLRVTLLNAVPTTETWADGDRRVDCFAVVEDGGTLNRSLLTP
jgi:hypothetical protein